MVAISSILAVAPLLAGVLATPAPAPPPRFNVKVQDSHKFDGLYLHAYHTGAGLADPTFGSKKDAAVGYLNGSTLLLDLGTTFPFGVSANLGDTNYARWEFVTIGAGGGSDNWSLKNNVLRGDAGASGESFAGWVICEWYHGNNVPQLFTAIKGFTGAPAGQEGVPNLPSSCANAKLVVEQVK